MHKLPRAIAYSFVLFAYLSGTGFSTRAAESLPKFGPKITRLHDAHDYVQKSAAPDYWALMPYYVPQKDEGSCSVAAISMVVNALRASQKLGSQDRLATQEDLVKKVDWDKGREKGIRGISLNGLNKLLELSLKEYHVEGKKIEEVRIDKDTPEMRKKFHDALAQNEKSATDFIIPLFIQGDLTGDPEGIVGHFAPIAAYDSKHKKVLIFDPDREWYEPYWVSEDSLFEAMADKRADSILPGGYVWVH